MGSLNRVFGPMNCLHQSFDGHSCSFITKSLTSVSQPSPLPLTLQADHDQSLARPGTRSPGSKKSGLLDKVQQVLRAGSILQKQTVPGVLGSSPASRPASWWPPGQPASWPLWLAALRFSPAFARPPGRTPASGTTHPAVPCKNFSVSASRNVVHILHPPSDFLLCTPEPTMTPKTRSKNVDKCIINNKQVFSNRYICILSC